MPAEYSPKLHTSSVKINTKHFLNSIDRFEVLQNLSKRYPRYYSVWFGTKYLFVTDDPHVSQKLLTIPNCVEKNFFMDFFGFPRGLIAMKCMYGTHMCQWTSPENDEEMKSSFVIKSVGFVW